MRFKHIRLIFAIIVSIIIIYAIYRITKYQTKITALQHSKTSIKYTKEIKIGISNFDSINPLITNNKEIININKLIYEPLFTIDENYKLQPCLATEFAKKNEISYIIKINTKIQWSNGEKIDSNDIKYTIENIKKTNSIYAENVKNIKNVNIIDNSTIEIELYQKEMFFEYNLIFPIVSEKYYENQDYFLSNKIPIGTGMLKIASVDEKCIILNKNDKWRNIEKLIYENVNIYIFNSIGEVYTALKTGKIDFMHTSNINYQDYVGKIGYDAISYKGRNLDFLSMNCKDDILKDKLVRLAISEAINKEEINSRIYNGNYYISNYPLDFGTFIYNDKNLNKKIELEQAQKNLINSGWKKENEYWVKDEKILEITLTIDATNEKRCEVGELIKQQLNQLGINTIIKKVSNLEYIECLQNKNYQVILTGISNSFAPDISYFYGETNLANYTNKDVLTYIDQLKNITNEKLLIEKMEKIIEITEDEMPYICLYRDKNNVLVNKNSGGQITPNNYFLYYNLESWYTQEKFF